MTANKEEITKLTFLERIATFDLERYYTPRVRFACHFLMWLVFISLLQLNLFLDSGLPYSQVLAFAVRSLLCEMTVFYLFFYVAVPHTLLKNKPVLALLSFIVCIYLWILLNHYLLIVIADHFNVQSPYYARGLKSNKQETIAYVLSPRNFFVGLIPVFYSISPFFFTKILFSIVRSYSKSFKSDKKAIELQMDKLNLEKDFLKAQLNPHFLFNTLNNLYGLSLRKDAKTPQVITQLSEMMRYTLYESNAEMVPLARELQYLRNYVMLEKMRYKNNTNIVCEIEDSRVDHHVIAPLLTFTFVENAFKYGLKKRNEGYLKMVISVDRNVFNFSIANDKAKKQKVTEFGGIGLENTRKRLQLLYPGKHKLSIEESEESYSVELTINLE